MFYIGNHLSSSGGFLAMGEEESSLGGNTFAFFTRNPRGGKAKALDHEDAQALLAYMEEHRFGTLVAHAPYTLNLCSDKPSVRQFAVDMFRDDLQRMEALPNQYYNFHPGSHVGQGSEEGIRLIADALNSSLFDGMQTTVLLECMSGKGSEIGGTFEELREIIDLTEKNQYLGVCLDTCHIWDAGYDISAFDAILDRFDEIIGLERLKAVHLNDSKNPAGSRKDRHERLGFGCIGSELLKSVVRNPRLQGLPFILETPNDSSGYVEEIRTVLGWAGTGV